MWTAIAHVDRSDQKKMPECPSLRSYGGTPTCRTSFDLGVDSSTLTCSTSKAFSDESLESDVITDEIGSVGHSDDKSDQMGRKWSVSET